MRNAFAFVLLISTLTAGCQGLGDLATPEVSSKTQVPAPGPLEVGKFSLPKEDRSLKLGDSLQQALRVFPEPSGAFHYADLPEGFALPYQSSVWETNREGFGVITYNDKAVLVMHQVEGVDQERLNQVVEAFRSMGGTTTYEFIPGGRVNYWFWEDRSQRLMVCGMLIDQKNLRITIALGERTVMDALGISATKARIDARTVDELFDRQVAQSRKRRR